MLKNEKNVISYHSYFCYIDGYSDFLQIANHPDDQEKTTFMYRRMPFGLCNAPATFRHFIMAIFSEFIKSIMKVFMEDFSVYGFDFDACLLNLAKVLKRCEDVNLKFLNHLLSCSSRIPHSCY